jgi:hypothetical protein
MESVADANNGQATGTPEDERDARADTKHLQRTLRRLQKSALRRNIALNRKAVIYVARTDAT